MTGVHLPETNREIYRSSSGDVWVLVTPPESGMSMVEHRPNLASGGKSQRFTIEDFLAGQHESPEHQALRAMLDADSAAKSEVDGAGEVIGLLRLGPNDSPPDEGDYILVMQGLSGEQRIVLHLSGMSHVSGHAAALLPSEDFCNSEVEAIARARSLASEHGLSTIYKRDDA
ncbi:MAG: hypothetical protein JWL93_757 [Hyphomicrobiales bacterium]|nr:hypothetical protein [Hyphomicrobiales bacterium]